MRPSRPNCRSVPVGPSIFLLVFASLSLPPPAVAQRTTDDDYLLGETQRLEIVVSVIGEVEHPGEYRVSDDTDTLELIAKAGGPTEFANLGKVQVRRRVGLVSGEERILRTDLTSFLQDEDAPAPPMLAPGDVVTVPRNKMAKWRTAFTLVRDVSVVATAYLLYLRVEQNR